MNELLSRTYKRNLKLLLWIAVFLAVPGTVLFLRTFFPSSKCSHPIEGTGKTITLRHNVASFSLWIMCVTEIVTITVWWVPQHGPWLQISLPTFWSWWIWTHCYITNALKNCNDREWLSVNTQIHRATSWPFACFHLAHNWLIMNFFLVTQIKTCLNRHTGTTKSFLECPRILHS